MPKRYKKSAPRSRGRGYSAAPRKRKSYRRTTRAAAPRGQRQMNLHITVGQPAQMSPADYVATLFGAPNAKQPAKRKGRL